MLSNAAQTRLLDPDVDARRKVDEEISRLEARLVSLKLARNELVPIARLHPEILQDIFSVVHSSSEPAQKEIASLRASWVSHRWRELAHQTAALWSYIDFKHPEWVETALSRTKNRELEFHLDCLGRTQRALTLLVPLCLANLSRMKGLSIRSDYQGMRYFAELKSSQPWMVHAPLLVKLNLDGLSLPPRLFSGICPSLQSLQLSSCSFDWDKLPIVPGLKKLVIIQPGTQGTIDDVMKILQIVEPGLEGLRLEDALAKPSGEPGAPPTMHQFQKLSYFKLSDDDPEMIASLLSQISFPRATNIEIQFPESADSDILQALVASRNLDEWPVDCLHIDIEFPSMTFFMLEDRSDEDGNTADDDKSGIELRVLDAGNLSDVLPIFTTLPIHPIEVVSFDFKTHCPKDTPIMDYIGKLGTVKELTLVPPSLETFLILISEQIDAYNAALDVEEVDDIAKTGIARRACSFDNLESIEIAGDMEIGPGYVFTREGLLVLQEWLTLRKRCGPILKKLVLSEVYVPPADWLKKLFKDLVNDFQMDEAEVKELAALE